MEKLLGLLQLLLLTACGNSIEFKKSPTPPNLSRSAQVKPESFESVSNKILKPHCIQCHSAYSEYENVFNEKEKILSAVLEGRMPKNAPSLTNDLKAVLNTWVKAGAPRGVDESDTKPEPEEPVLVATWESLSKNVFNAKCIQCHNPQGMARFLDLSTRQSFFDQREHLLNNFEDIEHSLLVEVITDPEEPMPPVWSNIERLNEKEIQTVIEWIKNGLP